MKERKVKLDLDSLIWKIKVLQIMEDLYKLYKDQDVNLHKNK